MTLDPSETRALILETLRKNGGNRGKAAESIGVPVRTFYRWISQFARWEVEALTAEMASAGTLDRETASATGHGPTREEVRKAWRVALGDRDVAARLLGLCVRRAVALAGKAGVKVAPVRKILRA